MGSVLKICLLFLVAVAYVTAYDDDDDNDVAVDDMLEREKRAIDEEIDDIDEASEDLLVREKRGGYCPPCPPYSYCKNGSCVCNPGYRKDSYRKCVRISYPKRRYGRYRRSYNRRSRQRYSPPPYGGSDY